MADQSGPARLKALFESALQAYEKETRVALDQHPLAINIQHCQSVDRVTTLLQGQVQAFNDFRETDRMMRAIKITVSNLTPLSAFLTNTIGSTSFPPTRAIQVGLGMLLNAAKGVISSCDVLADLLESIEHFVDYLRVYTGFSPTPTIDKGVIELILELISTLALVTRKLKQRRFRMLAKNVFAIKHIKEAKQRLDLLIQEEARKTIAQTPGPVDPLESTFIEDGNASTDSIRNVPVQMMSDINKMKRDNLRRDIHRWLSPPDPWKNYNIARGSRHEGTGAWFVNGSALSEWKESGPSSLLWIHGKPGAGKSVICSTIVDDIENICKAGDASLAMYYYDFREDQKKDLHGLLSSILFQLCDQSDSYYNILSTFHSTHRNGEQSPSDNDLVQCLKGLLNLQGRPPVYLIIDGLDECPSNSALSSPREKVISLLEDLVDARLSNLWICVTSRPEADIKPILEPLSFRSISLHDESGQKEDIENYIRSVVSTNRKMQRWMPENKQLVIDTLTERADGMFRWVYCQLEYLADCLPGRIRHALHELPDTLDATYERTLREIKSTNWEFARRLLQCVAVVSRPLLVEELAEILALDFKAGPIPKYREDWCLEDPVEAVLSTCSTLLALVNVDVDHSYNSAPVIQFSHFSVKEFLTSSRFAQKDDNISRRYHISLTLAHTFVTQACLGILFHLDESITRDGLTKYPLSEYAAGHWFEHARFKGVSRDADADAGVKQFFDRKKPHFAVWLWISDPAVPAWERRWESVRRPLPPLGTSLHYAAFCGLNDALKALVIGHPEDVNSRSFRDESTPLNLASSEGHVEAVRILLEHGADAVARDKSGSTPLHGAARIGHVALARLLIEHGADAAARSKGGWTPLHGTSKNGHVELARLLIEHGADATARTKGGSTPLDMASRNGHVVLAQLLIEHGADVAARTKTGSTPLHGASHNGQVELAQLLIEHGADTAARDVVGSTPLDEASRNGHLGLARLLLEHGANAAAQTETGATPLLWASAAGQLELAQLLIKYGANAAAQTTAGSTPLHGASENGHVVMARLLVKHGADAVARDSNGLTPLHLASGNGHVELARLLVEHGADVAAQSLDGSTPLDWASQSGHVELARHLIEHGANLATRSSQGSTPLDWASRFGHVELARLFIEHGADVVAQSSDGLTPLHWASQNGHLGLARLLIEHGADATARSSQGSTPLHEASQNGHLELAQLLIERGADAAARRLDGSTPLHDASENGHVELARLLVKHGASVAARTLDRLTPLHSAFQNDHVELARFLEEHNIDATAQVVPQLEPSNLHSGEEM